ncbi:NUDIX domain-containing protein [Actinacidiphila glaucinigra]|uniref:NUDIX domain-containing protein n=1 Tax=Actinacidiphila glaucinigra TaxID=235986 RepID=UPI002DD97F45|nr:NUDIX domain-containing protein [Actinacidiphila glaucinigra]WSD58890.1 NUDIX domain-containing protein [Actinacidiphila glaucinigra]
MADKAVRRSAGILLFRGTSGDAPEVLLAHMGGPFWSSKDAGAWTIPKGEYEPDETPEAAARREFSEELGLPVPEGELLPLGDNRQPNGKVVTVWALEGDLDTGLMVPGTFSMEWPRGSGRVREFPEVDRAAWFPLGPAAHGKILSAQRTFLDRLRLLLDGGGAAGAGQEAGEA